MTGERHDELDEQVRYALTRYLDGAGTVGQLRYYIDGVMWRTLAENPTRMLFVRQAELLLDEQYRGARSEASLRTELQKIAG